ncbi:MAG: pirin family protein [Nannocystis sp.]|nr:pirin family protein [Nannocystis sp.]
MDPHRRDSALETIIIPRARDLGGFDVRRALPAAQRQMVGPFIFLDEMGPVRFAPGRGLDVRPHPHIGLATVTWLLHGEILHRDSLGSRQLISPGEVNWMVAGRGIVHSERTPPAQRVGAFMHGLQAWMALPRPFEDAEPAFVHLDAADMPVLADRGLRLALIAGAGWGLRSPVPTYSDTVYADVTLAAGAALPLAKEHEERALYLIEGELELDGQRHAPGQLLVLRSGVDLTVRAAQPARFFVLGGEAMDGPRHIWWNFVASTRERIEAAKEQWRAGGFPPVPEEHEFIPLPDA